MVTNSTRNDLPLATKYEVHDKRSTDEQRCKLAERFGCGKTQICTILKNKEKIEELYLFNASGEQCTTDKRFRESKYSELNEALNRSAGIC